MTAIYRIRNWSQSFETYESRRLKALLWVAMPIKHDGRGIRRIMRRDPTGSLFGVWCLLVQVAAKCPQRGTLADNDGPLTALDIADKTGLSEASVSQALDVFVAAEIGWLEKINADGAVVPADGAVVPADGAVVPDCPQKSPLYKTRQDITEQRQEEGSESLPAFDSRDIVKAWNDTPGVVQIRRLTPKRETALRSRLRESDFVANWRTGLQRIAHSEFCRGHNDRGWRADIDWFIRPDTLTRLLEGKYDTTQRGNTGQARHPARDDGGEAESVDALFRAVTA